MLRDCARLTESLAKSVGLDKEAKARDALQMRPDTVTVWLGRSESIFEIFISLFFEQLVTSAACVPCWTASCRP